MATQEADSIPAIGRQIAEDAARLVHDEIALAKAEVMRALKALAFSIGLAFAALALLLLVGVAGLGALADGVGEVLFHKPWVAWLILLGLFLVLSLLCAYLAYRGIRRTIGGGKRTVDNFKEDVEWLKHLTKRDTNEN